MNLNYWEIMPLLKAHITHLTERKYGLRDYFETNHTFENIKCLIIVEENTEVS